jgi:serine/threonine protein kinase
VEEKQSVYIVMPLLNQSAKDWLRFAHERALIETLRFLDRVADALDFLHRQAIIHQDLKPENILLDKDNQPYLLDFGLSKKFDPERLPKKNSITGTLIYVSPELLKGEPSTSSRDIYAFGILVYEAITGQHPYAHLPTNQMIMQLLNVPLPSIKLLRPELAPATVRDIDSVIGKLTAKNPDERYKTALEAVIDLNRIVNSGQQVIDGKLYISYSYNDKPFVYALADELQRYNVNVHIDRNLDYGANWDEALDKMLDDCDMLLLIVTETSIASYYVTYEWSYFLGMKKPIIPLLREEDVGKLSLPHQLDRRHYITVPNDINLMARKIIQSMSQTLAAQRKEMPTD